MNTTKQLIPVLANAMVWVVITFLSVKEIIDGNTQNFIIGITALWTGNIFGNILVEARKGKK